MTRDTRELRDTLEGVADAMCIVNVALRCILAETCDDCGLPWGDPNGTLHEKCSEPRQERP